MGPLDELTAFARERFARVAAARAAGERVVGYVGDDVPREAIEAAGFLPLRLAPVAVDSQAKADAMLGHGVDEPARLVLAALLEGRYPIDFLVLCHDCDHTVRLHAVLRVLARRNPGCLPPLHFLDLLHLPTETTAAYDRARLVEFARVLERWAGSPLARAALVEAVVAANESRRLLRRVDERRRRGALDGSRLLAVVAAGTAMRAAPYAALLRRLLEEPEWPAGSPRRRVYLLGSAHDAPDLYEALEARGAAIVGEDHAWGALSCDGLVDEGTEPLEALAARHHLGCALARGHDTAAHARRASTDAAAAAADVAVAWHRAGDDALAWRIPEESRAFAAYGIPFVALRQRPYRLDSAALCELGEATA